MKGSSTRPLVRLPGPLRPEASSVTARRQPYGGLNDDVVRAGSERLWRLRVCLRG